MRRDATEEVFIMYYRMVLVNKKTGKRSVQFQQFTSKKKAIEYADKWKESFPSADCEIFKSDMKTRIY